jgi:hypothetical protein
MEQVRVNTLLYKPAPPPAPWAAGGGGGADRGAAAEASPNASMGQGLVGEPAGSPEERGAGI